jgi:putative aldouronate transport system permease protein
MFKKIDKKKWYSFKLFLYVLPFIILVLLFSYYPLYGWVYAFYDYRPPRPFSDAEFVGFKWFLSLVENEVKIAQIWQVLKNTFVMSGITLSTSWIPMLFAVFMNELKCVPFRKFVQTVTTLPNFISWVLVYAIALPIFASHGFINSIMGTNTQFLMDPDFMWIKMWAWGTWKGLGWSAIIYIAGISGIDQQLYEAATVDGAGRFQKMWHITVPGLIPTFMVLLLMSVAGVLSNGMDQYLVFENANNKDWLNVLDLYVYKLGINSGAIPLSTVVGMTKSIISVVLLFLANGISKLARGESIV